jgi:hypothetical protein
MVHRFLKTDLAVHLRLIAQLAPALALAIAAPLLVTVAPRPHNAIWVSSRLRDLH